LSLTAAAGSAEGEFEARLTLVGDGTVHALSARLDFDPAQLEPIGSAAPPEDAEGALLVLQATPDGVDAAWLGASRTFAPTAEVARLRFRTHGPGPFRVSLAEATGRDAANNVLSVARAGAVDQPPPRASFSLGDAYPNPFRALTAIPITLPDAGWARLEIFDATGRVVRRLSLDGVSAGRHEPTWDGRNDAGRRVSSGVYLVRLSTSVGVRSRSIRFVR
jgi:hypothetical protein